MSLANATDVQSPGSDGEVVERLSMVGVQSAKSALPSTWALGGSVAVTVRTSRSGADDSAHCAAGAAGGTGIVDGGAAATVVGDEMVVDAAVELVVDGDAEIVPEAVEGGVDADDNQHHPSPPQRRRPFPGSGCGPSRYGRERQRPRREPSPSARGTTTVRPPSHPPVAWRRARSARWTISPTAGGRAHATDPRPWSSMARTSWSSVNGAWPAPTTAV